MTTVEPSRRRKEKQSEADKVHEKALNHCEN